MKQPELGIRIGELRIQNSMTQRELADLCNIDIRTIQRIETGEVVPRMHTLRLLSTALGAELSNGNRENNFKVADGKIKVSFVAGIIFSINSIPVVFYMITKAINPVVYLLSVTIFIVSSIIFFRGFYFIGKQFSNTILYVSALITIILLPLINLTELLKNFLFKPYYHPPVMIASVIFTLLCINAIIFGIGLWIEANKRKGTHKINLYTIAGLITIIQSVLFLSINFTLASIGLIISIGTDVLLTIILYREYKHLGKAYIKTSQATALAW